MNALIKKDERLLHKVESFPIKGFLETSLLDWCGKLSAVLFLPGCNFRCPYCHNTELVLQPHKLPDVSMDYVLRRLRKFKGWIDGIVVTGGEPTLQPALPSFIRRIKKKNWLVKLDTNGSNIDMLKQLIDEQLLDCVALDIKAPLNEVDYYRATGRCFIIESIKECLELLKSSNIDYELRTTVCPGLIDKKKLKQLLPQIKGAKRLVLQNFRPSQTIDSRLQHLMPYPKEYMQELGQMSEGYVNELRVVE